MPVPSCTPEQLAQCFNGACVNAKNAFASANNQTLADCQQLAADTSQRNSWATIAGGLLAAAIALAAIAASTAATIFGIPVAVVLWIVAGVLFALATVAFIVAFIYQQKVNADNAMVRRDLTNAQNAAGAVVANCPECCRPGPLQISNCNSQPTSGQ